MAVVLFWPLTLAIFMSFFSYVFSSSSLLYTTLVTFRCSSIWGLLLLEARYYRGAKDDIKSWYDCALLCHMDGFFSSRPCKWYFTTLRGISNTSPVAECILSEYKTQKKGSRNVVNTHLHIFLHCSFSCSHANTSCVLPYVLSYVFDLNIDHWEINML